VNFIYKLKRLKLCEPIFCLKNDQTYSLLSQNIAHGVSVHYEIIIKRFSEFYFSSHLFNNKWQSNWRVKSIITINLSIAGDCPAALSRIKFRGLLWKIFIIMEKLVKNGKKFSSNFSQTKLLDDPPKWGDTSNICIVLE